MNEKYSVSGTKAMSDDIRQISQAFLLAKREFVATGRSARNDHQKYSYAKIGDIYNAVEEALMKNNIIIWHYSTIQQDNQETLVTRLIHTQSGQFVEDSRLLISEKPGNQAKGAANTYMKKYALLSLCAISTEDDDAQEEERYIAKKSAEPAISEEQLKDLQELIKVAPNKVVIYKNILKFNKLKDLAELKAGSFEYVKTYITNTAEHKAH